MAKKSFDQDDDQPFDYFKDLEAGKQEEKPKADDLVSSMRSDMLSTSDIAPTHETIFQRINLKIVVGILFGLFFLTLIWFFISGPGRPMLEHNLAVIVHKNATATLQTVPSLVTMTFTPPQPSSTPLPSATRRPTNTPTVRVAAAATSPAATASPTTSSGCRDALTITIADVGQTMCVQGTVIETVDRPTFFMVIFSKDPGSFYWVTYDLVWSQAKLDTCYQTTGKIEQIANRPILIFNYNNLPQVCP